MSVDAIIVLSSINKMQTNNKAKPEEQVLLLTGSANTSTSSSENSSDFGIVNSLISFAIFVFAVYLSWTCNSKCFPSMSGFEKVFRAFFAGFFGGIYLLIYFISWSAGCSTCVPAVA